MITNIINPLLQAVSFISIWYLYQTMSKIKPLRGHLLLLKEAVEHRGDLRAGRRALRVKHPVGLPLDQTAADRPLHRCPCII